MSQLLKFSAEQMLPCRVEDAFGFFANPANLPHLMPAWQRARIEEAILAAPPRMDGKRLPGAVAGDGSRITISFRPLPYLPIRFRWEALIQDFSWDQGFCDLQLHGLFMFWRHCHTLTSANGGSACVLRDEISYELPFGPLSSTADLLAVRRLLHSMFRYRHKRTLELLSRR